MQQLLCRRNILKMFGWGTFSLTTMMSSMAISCQDVFKNILEYTPTALQAISGILALLSGANPAMASGALVSSKAILATVSGLFNTLQAAVNEYNSAPAANKNTALGKVKVILSDISDNFQSFLNDLSLPDPKLAELVIGLVTLILSTLSGFSASLPAGNAPAARTLREITVKGKVMQITPQKRSPKDFKDEYNKLCDANGHPEVKF